MASTLPEEAQALREIARHADILDVDGQPYLLSPVSAATVDALAALDAETEDMEPDDHGEDEDGPENDDDDGGVYDHGRPVTEDDEPDYRDIRIALQEAGPYDAVNEKTGEVLRGTPLVGRDSR